MAIRDLAVELKDIEDIVKRDADKPYYKKLKFKAISRKNIALCWNKFRLKRLREKLAETTFIASEIERGKHAEKKVLRRAKKIAELEAKVRFIESGEHTKASFVETRALNIKKLMMDNLRSTDSFVYGLDKSVAEQIKSGDINITKTSTEDKSKSNSATIVIPPNKQKCSDDSNNTEKAQTISRENVEKTIKKALDGSEISSTSASLSKEFVRDTIEEELKRIDGSSGITKDSIRSAIEDEMNKINMPAKNNDNFHIENDVINQDGSYRLKKEDIPDEFRINYCDIKQLRQQLEQIKKEAIEKYKNMDAKITPITPREIPRFDLNFDKLPCVVSRHNETQEDDTQRVVPLIAPSRTNVEEGSKKSTIEIGEKDISSDTASEIEELLKKVYRLKEKRASLALSEKAAKEELSETSAKLRARKEELSSFASSLKEDCDRYEKSCESLEEKKAAEEEKIAIILAAMTPETPTEPQKGRGK